MPTDPDLGDMTVVTMQGWTLTHEPGLRMHFVVSGETRWATMKKTSLADVLWHTRIGIRHPTSPQNGQWRTQGKKEKEHSH